LVNTNGEVVSPTNFWQAAPISTTVQYQTNVTGTSTNAATNSRNLFLFSLAPSVSGVTNTVTLPTNPATTFEGDRATITHLANSTTAVTAIRQLGAATNLITLNQLDETVLLMYRSGEWRLADNISYIEPIYFSGTNAAANAAASRTNLGLGASWLTNTNVTNFRTEIGLGETSEPNFQSIELTEDTNSFTIGAFAGVNRTNLGLGAAWLTNANVTNFRTAIGLGATNDVTFNKIVIGDYTFTNTGIIGFNGEIDFEEGDLTLGSGGEWNLGGSGMNTVGAISFASTTNAATTRTNLELGATNIPTFSNVSLGGLSGGSLIVGATTGGNLTRSTGLNSTFGTTYVIGNVGSTLTNWTPTNFQAAVFTTNAAPTNTANSNQVNFNTAVRWMDVTLNIGGTNQTFRIPLFQ
jgi:hypothetical protein